jgi:hypothetical protein
MTQFECICQVMGLTVSSEEYGKVECAQSTGDATHSWIAARTYTVTLPQKMISKLHTGDKIRITVEKLTESGK